MERGAALSFTLGSVSRGLILTHSQIATFWKSGSFQASAAGLPQFRPGSNSFNIWKALGDLLMKSAMLKPGGKTVA